MAHQEGNVALRDTTPAYRMDLSSKLEPPDGVSYHWIDFNEVIRWVAPERTLFEAAEAWHQVERDRIGPIHLEGTPQQPKRAVFELSSHDNMMGRGFKEERGWWTLSFDDEGRLDEASYDGATHLTDPSDQPYLHRYLVDVSWNEDGKVARVDYYRSGPPTATPGWYHVKQVLTP